MRGGKTLAERGVIPRLLSGIYRRSRKIEGHCQETSVAVFLSYYEIYNDKVFDLFEPPSKRTSAGLSLRDNGGKTVVVGLTERPCTTLREFESLYDQANMNRSRLNSYLSRSHAVLCVKVAITSGNTTRVSTASTIDLASSGDNRQTDKSLFVLARCAEAINKKQQHIPFRESKITRILSLGQNDGLTIMILNLAPVRSHHLATLSSLDFTNRAKNIEIWEVENEPVFKGGKTMTTRPSTTRNSLPRQPLRVLTAASVNASLSKRYSPTTGDGKPVKEFSVYSDNLQSQPSQASSARKPGFHKRPSWKASTRIHVRNISQEGGLLNPKQTDIPASITEEMI